MSAQQAQPLIQQSCLASLQGLEDRFLGQVEPKLSAAMSQKNGERVQQLSSMLMGIQCYDTVQKLYVTARMAPLQVSISP